MAFRKEYLARLESEIDCPKQVFELGTESAIEQAEYLHKSSYELFVEALKLGESAAKVYMFLWEAAGMAARSASPPCTRPRPRKSVAYSLQRLPN